MCQKCTNIQYWICQSLRATIRCEINICCWNKLFYKISEGLAFQTQSEIDFLRKLSTWVESQESRRRRIERIASFGDDGDYDSGDETPTDDGDKSGDDEDEVTDSEAEDED